MLAEVLVVVGVSDRFDLVAAEVGIVDVVVSQ